MFEIGLIAFLAFGYASLWLFGRFLSRLKSEFPGAWGEGRHAEHGHSIGPRVEGRVHDLAAHSARGRSTR